MNTPTNAAMRPSYREVMDSLAQLLREATQEMSGLPHSLGYDFTHTRKMHTALLKYDEYVRETEQRETLDAAQPAQASEAVAYCDPSDPRPERAFSWPGTARNPQHETPLYLHPQPEQSASAMKRAEDASLEAWNEMFSDLHPATACLVWNFAIALGNKLRAAEEKYGYSDGWRSKDWMDECRQHLVEHVAKGDPRDVAAYCAFLWHHGESTTQSPAVSPPSVVAVSEDDAEAIRVGVIRLKNVVGLLRENGNFRDEEGEDTDDLEALTTALESFASRIGSGERDAVETLREMMRLYDTGTPTTQDDLDEMYDRCRAIVARYDAAIAQQNKRGDQK